MIKEESMLLNIKLAMVVCLCEVVEHIPRIVPRTQMRGRHYI